MRHKRELKAYHLRHIVWRRYVLYWVPFTLFTLCMQVSVYILARFKEQTMTMTHRPPWKLCLSPPEIVYRQPSPTCRTAFPAQHLRLSCWPDGLELTPGFYPGIQRAAQSVLGVYLKRTCSRDTSASSALRVLNDYTLYKSTHSLTHSPSYRPVRKP